MNRCCIQDFIDWLILPLREQALEVLQRIQREAYLQQAAPRYFAGTFEAPVGRQLETGTDGQALLRQIQLQAAGLDARRRLQKDVLRRFDFNR